MLFVPKLSYSLLSVSKATDSGLKVTFDDSECKVVGAEDNRSFVLFTISTGGGTV